LFVDTQDKYKRDGLVIIGVAIDTTKEVQQFVDSYFINYPVLINDQENTELMALYGNRIATLPYSVLIDKQGKIVARHTGAFHKSQLEQILAKALTRS
jgi:peroxiredoxin